MEKFKLPFISFAFALLILVIAIIFANLLYRPKIMAKRGYEIKISADGKVVKKEEKPVDIATLLRVANIENGAKIFKKCASCHSAEKNGGNKVGPNLFGVVGRSKAGVSSFSYSDAMKKKGGSWNVEDLNQFITKPKDFVAGTKMGFSGLKKPQDRADVIRYLESRR